MTQSGPARRVPAQRGRDRER